MVDSFLTNQQKRHIIKTKKNLFTKENMAVENLMKDILDPKELQKELLEWTKEELWWLKEEIVIWIKGFFGESKLGKFFGDKLSKLAASILGVEIDKEDKVQTDKTNRKIDPYNPSLGLLRLDKVAENIQEFSDKVISIAQDLQINPNRLMHIMKRESWLNPQAKNNNWGAVWLIQFMADNKDVDYKTINGKQYKISDIQSMSNIEQLNIVAEYYKTFKWKINSYEDLYLVTFYPVALWKPDNYILWSERSDERAASIWKQNPINDGKPISIADVKKRIAKDIPDNYIAQFDGVPQTPTTA